LQVALELACAGAEIGAIIELARETWPWAIFALGRMITSAPTLVLRGIRYLAELRRRRIPLLHESVLAGIARSDGGFQVEVKPWPAQRKNEGKHFEADTILMGYGFMPNNEILRALGCAHYFDASRGHLVTARDKDGRTSVANVYAVGDCGGLGGALAAEAEGVIAGLAAARSLAFASGGTERDRESKARSALARHRRFQAGLWQLYRAPHLTTELATPETLICRCEGVSLREITTELREGWSSVGALKRRTRCGMGRCQGRYCGPIVAALSAYHRGCEPDEEGYWAPRPPVRPVPIGDM
jgi:hypothetical protein